MKPIVNVVFDLGGVLFSRDPRKFEPEFIEYFSYIHLPQMPRFWEDYDRGVVSFDEVVTSVADYNNSSRELAENNIRRSIVTQEVITPTAELIATLREAGLRLFVLSNMSREFIDFLREQPVYKFFDGDVVSCEEGVIKPEAEIYNLLTERYNLDPSETLFVDDRKANIEAAENLGWQGYLFTTNRAKECCEELRELIFKN
jgi:HAD superfamily hydrolase (TIGR01509 family)